MLRFFHFVICLLIIIGKSYSQTGAVQPILNYTADIGGNLIGGFKQKFCYIGLLEAGVNIFSDSLHGWKGGLLNLDFISTHGKGITHTATYDLQGISGIEAGNHPFLFWEVWYHQQIGKWGFRMGLQDVNRDFMNQPFAEAFTVSSYGMFPTLSINYSLPNYPVSGLGFTLSYTINSEWSMLGALYDGKVTDLDKDRFNTHWKANLKKYGVLAMGEVKYTSAPDALLNSTYGFGTAFHSKMFPGIIDPAKLKKRNYTFYSFAEHDLFKDKYRNAGLFIQSSFAPCDRNTTWLYTAAGFVCNGFFSKEHTDKAGIGVSQLYYQLPSVTGQLKRGVENIVELYFQFQPLEQISLKPTLFAISTVESKFIFAFLLRLNIILF